MADKLGRKPLLPVGVKEGEWVLQARLFLKICDTGTRRNPRVLVPPPSFGSHSVNAGEWDLPQVKFELISCHQMVVICANKHRNIYLSMCASSLLECSNTTFAKKPTLIIPLNTVSRTPTQHSQLSLLNLTVFPTTPHLLAHCYCLRFLPLLLELKAHEVSLSPRTVPSTE